MRERLGEKGFQTMRWDLSWVNNRSIEKLNKK
jgi:hypothetical protein